MPKYKVIAPVFVEGTVYQAGETVDCSKEIAQAFGKDFLKGVKEEKETAPKK